MQIYKTFSFSKRKRGFLLGTLAQWNKVVRSGMKWEIGATRKSCWNHPGWELTPGEGIPKGPLKRDSIGRGCLSFHLSSLYMVWYLGCLRSDLYELGLSDCDVWDSLVCLPNEIVYVGW